MKLKKGESLLSSTPVVVLSAILGRTPSIDEYKVAIRNIELNKFKPSLKEMTSKPNHLVSFWFFKYLIWFSFKIWIKKAMKFMMMTQLN